MNNEKLQSNFYSGLSGLQLNIPKKQYPPAYQAASRLTYYSSLFNSIEFNSSFYKIPMATTVRRWSASVNENFKFTFKFWKQVTHNKGLNFAESDVELFLKTAALGGNKKGCLLIQFPPSLGIDNIDQFTKQLSCIKQFDFENQWNVAVEFRNMSWYNEKVYELLDFYRSAIVKHDKSSSAPPVINSKVDFIYVRFHGPSGNYRDSYSDDFLSEYAGYLKAWIEEGKTVYVYFNNTMGDAFNNLVTLNKEVRNKF